MLLETSGERPLAKVPERGGKDRGREVSATRARVARSLPENLKALTPRDEVKFVIASRTDYEFAREFLREHGLEARVSSVILSPAFRKDATGSRDVSHCLVDPQDLAEWMLADDLKARLGLQIHKFIWEPSMKGV